MKNPILTWIIGFLLLGGGWMGYQHLHHEENPQKILVVVENSSGMSRLSRSLTSKLSTLSDQSYSTWALMDSNTLIHEYYPRLNLSSLSSFYGSINPQRFSQALEQVRTQLKPDRVMVYLTEENASALNSLGGVELVILR